MRRIFISSCTLICASLSAAAQATNTSALPEKWRLQDCIEYAQKENLDIRKSRLLIEEAEEDIALAKAASHPNLTFGANGAVQNSPWSEQEDKTIVSGSYNLSSSMVLYEGGKLRMNRKLAQLNADIDKLNLAQTENDMALSITEAFVNILYAAQSIHTGKSAVATDRELLRQREEEHRVGKCAESDVIEMQAALASDSANLVSYQTAYESSVLQLKLLLQLDIAYNFTPDTIIHDFDVMASIPDKIETYQHALSSLPEIQRAQLSIKQAELQKDIARAGYRPSLSLNASVSTSHNSVGVGNQLKTNFGESISLGLTVPIYSRRETKTAVRKAEIGINESQISYSSAKQALMQTIETYYLNSVSSQQKYTAALVKLKSEKTTFDLVNQKYEIGQASSIDLLEEKDNMLDAEIEVNQAKYNAMLYRLLLGFYAGEEISL
ncbi:MAG: TolC family protein [Bacteroidales bacterium]|nr:TolC family protein [Bacteroidales bacterium]